MFQERRPIQGMELEDTQDNQRWLRRGDSQLGGQGSQLPRLPDLDEVGPQVPGVDVAGAARTQPDAGKEAGRGAE